MATKRPEGFSPSPAQEHILQELTSGAKTQREIHEAIPDDREENYNLQYIRDEGDELVDEGFIRRVGKNTGVYEITPKGVRWTNGIQAPIGRSVKADDLKHRATHICLHAALLAVLNGPFRSRDAVQLLENPPHRTTVSRILAQAEKEGWVERRSDQGPYYPGPVARELKKPPEERASLEEILGGGSEILGEDLF